MKIFTQPITHELLMNIADGDEVAFCQLFKKYQQPVYSYSRHFTHSDLIAEEITQEVFIKVWINKDILARLENFDAWVMTITRNCCFNQLKKMAGELKLKNKLSITETGFTENIDQYIYDKENQTLLTKALEGLSPQQRLIFNLNREKGLKNSEIAQKLNLSPNTVKTHMVSALRRLKEYFESHPISVIILYTCCHYFL